MSTNNDENATNELAIEREVLERYASGFTDSQFRASRYERYHHYYAPPGGDQWPEDLLERPGKLHITANIIRAFVDTEARLLAIPPRLTLPPNMGMDDALARRAEATEKLFQKYLDMSGFEEWSFTFNQIKSLYGFAVLKPFWNVDTKSPDVEVVEQPQNIIFGWGDSDFRSIDWAIYYYRISRAQASRNWGIDRKTLSEGQALIEKLGGGDHADPVETVSISARQGRNITDYERSHVTVFDYWFVDKDGIVTNALIVSGKMVELTPHPEMPVVPYIPVESEHEPGSPDGHGIAELLLDVQMGINRAFSHYAQHVWDQTDPAYQLVGDGAPSVIPPGTVPESGEAVAPGPGARWEEIRSGVNTFPFDALINQYWTTAHRITGLSEILFGAPPASQTSGRALQAQLDSSINRLSPKRTRYYEGLRGLLRFWHFMTMKVNPRIDGIPVKKVITGLNNWKIVAPEITPRDVIEHTQNIMDKVNGKLISLESAMDEIGVDNPLQEIDKIMAERSNAHLFPGDAQAIAAVVATLQAIQSQQNQNAMGAAQQGQNAQNAAVADAQQAQPTRDQSQNMPGPATGPGMPPPNGAPAPGGAPAPIGGQLQPLVRQTAGGQSQAMSQLVLPQRTF